MPDTVLDHALAVCPDRPAVTSAGRGLTYRDLDDQSARVAAGWAGHGIAAGDRVAALLDNRPELVVAYLAAFRTGAVLVPLPAVYQAPQVEYAIKHSGSRAVIVQADKVTDVPPGVFTPGGVEHGFVVGGTAPRPFVPFESLLAVDDPQPTSPHSSDAPALIFYTSGTTSRPKGVLFDRRAVAWGIRQWRAAVPFGPDDAALISSRLTMPLSVRGQLLPILSAGGTAALVNRFDTEAWVAEFCRPPRKTLLGLYPAAVQRLLDTPGFDRLDFSSVRVCLCGGDRTPAPLQAEFLERTGVPLTVVCGLTEGGPYAMNPPFGRKLTGTVGPAFYGTAVRVLDRTGKDAVAGEEGAVWVRSDAMMTGYWADPGATEAVVRGGWLATGDLGRLDPDGYLCLTGRVRDLIIRDSRNVAPVMVEEILCEHPGVAEAGVAGIPDPPRGQAVGAVIVPRPGGDFCGPAALAAWAACRLEPLAVPREILVTDRLPRTALGKVDRTRIGWWVMAGGPV